LRSFGRDAALAWVSLLCAGCASDGFPEDFLFGAAISGFQTEMGCPSIPAGDCEDRRSDWYQFITSTVTVSRESNLLIGHPPSMGPGYYELWREDLDRAKALGLNAFRFGIEWSRVFPESTRGVTEHEALRALASEDALRYYREQLSVLREHGIKPLVTLNHQTLPSWVHDAVGCNVNLDRCSPRGWLEPWIAEEIAKYAGFIARELANDVEMWATLNEPLATSVPGYLLPTITRSNPPAASLRFEEARTSLRAQIEAHARMYDAVHANDPTARVGIVYNVAPQYPKDPNNALDVRAARNVDYLFNGAFLNAVLRGVLDDDLDGKGDEQESLKGRCDFLGVNYYTRVILEGETESVLPGLSPLATFDPLTIEQGAHYSRGLYEVLVRLANDYPGVPLLVTENGADARTGDTTPFLIEHLEWLLAALDEGVNVEGYFWWSLMDNYEWNNGMTYQFGLYAVDPLDPLKKRTPRPIAEAYRKVIEARDVPRDLKEAHPIARD
jgi:beta-galactosidase